MTATLCLSCSLRCSTRGLGVHSIGAFPRAPSVGCGLPYHIWSLAVWNSAGNCFGGFPSAPSVGCGLPYHILSLTLWESAGNCIGGFPRSPSVGCGLTYHISSLTLWGPLATALAPQTELNNNSTPTRSPTGSLNRMFNRHQAEITVMRFRGYSLLVHDCNGITRPSPCPIS